MVRRRTELQNVPRQHLTGKLHTTEELKYTDCECSHRCVGGTQPWRISGFLLNQGFEEQLEGVPLLQLAGHVGRVVLCAVG